jgi:hypothetical protein
MMEVCAMTAHQLREAAVLLCVVALGAATIAAAGGMPAGARTFPLITAYAMTGFAVASIAQILVASSTVGPVPAGSSRLPVLVRLAAFVGLSVGFVLAMPVTGFEIAGAVYLIFGMLLLMRRDALRFWWIALVMPPLLGGLFRGLLNLRLPLPPFMT